MDSNNIEILAAVATDHRNIPTLRAEHPPYAMDKNALATIQKLVDRTADHVLRSAVPSTVTGDLEFQSAYEEPPLEPLIEGFATPRRYPTLPCVVLDISRQRNKDFIGRTNAISELEEHLLYKQQVAVVHGIGGVGKSDLALEFAHRHKDDFDAIFWIPADDIAKMRHDFSSIAVRLGLQTEDEARYTDSYSSRNIAKVRTSKMTMLEGANVNHRHGWLIPRKLRTLITLLG